MPAPYPDYSSPMTVMEPRTGHGPDLLARAAAALDRLARAACVALVALLGAAQLAVVLLRYGFGTGFLPLQDVVTYAFAALVLLGLPVALAADRHVRVDVLRERQGPRARRAWDAAGVLLLLAPAFALTAWYAWPDVAFSWGIREGARETGGLGGVYLVKALVPVSCALVLVQGLASLRAPRPSDAPRAPKPRAAEPR